MIKSKLISLLCLFIFSSCQGEGNNINVTASSLKAEGKSVARSSKSLGKRIKSTKKVSNVSIGERCNEIKYNKFMDKLSRPTSFDEALSCKFNFDNGQKLILGQPSSITAPSICSSDETLVGLDPDEVLAVERRLVTKKQQRVSDYRSVETVYTLPIVFHIIHTGEAIGSGYNISNEQIYSAVEELNNHFRKKSGTHGDGDGADTKIQFALAVRDPSGNSTNGIMRVDGSSVPDYTENGIEAGQFGADETAVKNLSKWNQDEYINVWVVNKIAGDSSIQGYAYFPTTSTNDGVVMKNTALGTVGTVEAYLNLSTVLTHEIGHYFALYHAFYLSNDCSESNCETQGDKLCDTPVTTMSPNCSTPVCTENSTPQNVHLYMDYTGQACKNQFSQGQKGRMRDALESERPGLISSLALQPVTTNDVALISVISPTNNVCDQSQNAKVIIGNFGQNTINSFNLKVKRDGLTIFNQTISENITAGNSKIIDAGLIVISSGSHNYEFIASSPNGNTDENNQNNSISKAISRLDGNINLALTIQLDYFGSETTWTLVNDQNQTLQSGGPFQNNTQGTIVNEDICVPQGCYTFNMFDEHGDGQSFLNGSFQLNNNGSVIAENSGDWGSQSTTNFCTGQPPAPTCYTSNDLQTLTSSFGTSENLQYDSNNDGTLTVVDLNHMLANSCPEVSIPTTPSAL
jgi:hypothetical protein